jgi:hypothetical protein
MLVDGSLEGLAERGAGLPAMERASLVVVFPRGGDSSQLGLVWVYRPRLPCELSPELDSVAFGLFKFRELPLRLPLPIAPAPRELISNAPLLIPVVAA